MQEIGYNIHMSPESEIKRRQPRLQPEAIALVQKALGEGLLSQLTERQQSVLSARYDHNPPPTLEDVARQLYPDHPNPRVAKGNVSEAERAGLKRLKGLLGLR